MKTLLPKLRAALEPLRARLRRPSVRFTPAPGARKIDWDKLYRKSFTYNSVGALVCGYFAADLLVASLTPWFPPAEAPRPRAVATERRDFFAYSRVILPRGKPNLFSERGLVPDNDEGGGNPDGPPVKTSLPLNLLGVIVVKDLKKSVASVEDKGANQVIAVRVGEPISRDTEVLEIREDRVIFLNNATNRREYLELPQDASVLHAHRAAGPKSEGGIANLGGNHIKVEKTAMQAALGKDFGQILTQALCSPEMQGGKPIGYKCTQIEAGSIYERLGLQNGDVVTAMDGESLTNMGPLMQKLGELREGRVQKLSITINRGGQPITTYFDLD